MKQEVGQQNLFNVEGEVIQLDGDKATVKIITKAPRNKTYEELLLVTVPETLKCAIQPGTMQCFAGHIERGPGEEARLMVDAVEEGTEGYFNFCQVLAKIFRRHFYEADPEAGKKQSLFIYAGEEGNEENEIGAVAFQGLSNKLKAIAEGSIVLMGGRLRRKAFADGSGLYSTDIVLDPTKTKIVYEAKERELRPIGNKPAKPAKAKKKV